ncbi:MAG TPA: response regulator, partial [Chthoniobacteraceae bacterium]|nr:response regulator [Chthoniobacteraceae bacterium]
MVLLYNDAWSPIAADKHPWALGRPGAEVWPEIWDDIAPLFQQVQATGVPVRRRDQLLPMRRRGFTEECYFDFTFSLIRDEQGAAGGVFNAVLETTSRVLGERRLRLLHDLAANTADAHNVEDACEQTIRSMSEYARDLPFALIYLVDAEDSPPRLISAHGIERGASVSWPFNPSEAHLVEDLTLVLSTPLPIGPWPEPVQQALVLPLVRAGQGKAVGFLVTGLSPRLALDEEYRSTLGLIADSVTTALDRARAQTEERRRAEQLAALDRAKTAFFSNVSHELRTPLTLLLGPIDDILALDDSTPLRQGRERLVIAQRNGLRLQKLVNTLLDFSRIEAGRMLGTFSPFDLAALTTDFASTFRSAMEKAGLRLVVDCRTLPEPVWVDRDAWEKIMLNLLSNAFKFTLAGEVAVELRAANGRAQIKVRDTGVGMPAVELGKVFERFHRIEGQRGRSMEGTGIGLALVQELVKLHGGEVRLESVENQGTTFTITLPFGNAHLPADRMAISSGGHSTALAPEHFVGEAALWLPGEDEPIESATSSARIPAACILVADDNADMRTYATRLLTEHGYAVEVAMDGEAALAAVRAHHPDLVLADVMMPRLDGFGLLAALRSDPSTRSLPVVLLSARAGEEARIEGIAAGADDYLVKPFGARELIATLTARLEITRVRRANEARHALFARLYEAIRPLQDPEEIVQAVSAVVGEHFAVDRCSYTELNVEGTHATIMTDWRRGDLVSIAGVHDPLSYGNELIASLKAGQVAVIADTENDPLTSSETARASFRAIQSRGVLIVPLVKESRLVANFFLLTREPRYWTSAEMTLAEQVAEQTWTALAAARTAEALRTLEERNRRQAAEQQAIYETALSTMPDFTYIFDLQGRFAYSNEALVNLLGITRKEIVGKSFHDLPYP